MYFILSRKFPNVKTYWIGLNKPHIGLNQHAYETSKDTFVWFGKPKTFKGYIKWCHNQPDTSHPEQFGRIEMKDQYMCLGIFRSHYRKPYICENENPLELKAKY